MSLAKAALKTVREEREGANMNGGIEWNLGKGLENVCNSIMDKLHYAGFQCESRERTIINLDSYEITAMIWAMRDYMRNRQFAERK